MNEQTKETIFGAMLMCVMVVIYVISGVFN